VTAILLGYRDLPAARERFVGGLAFDSEFELVDDDEGGLVRAHVRLGETVLLLARQGAHGIKHPQDVGGVTHLLVINVGGNVDEHRDRAVEFGLIAEPAIDQPWGREYELHDPEGYVFAFIE
jgi:uncharacterized glyoxalase superfamily protein PhnB